VDLVGYDIPLCKLDLGMGRVLPGSLYRSSPSEPHNALLE
jgi:hypothetical protein